MNKIALLLPVLALAACGQEPAPEAQPTQVATPEPVVTMPPPHEETFRTAFAEACEGAERVNKALCKRAGMGSDEAVCDYGLGDDEYRRHAATLKPNENRSGWMLADAEKVCAEHGATAAQPETSADSESQ